MSGYHEYRYWSPTLGGDAVRLSMVDKRGGEFYRIILVSSGFVRDDDGKRVSRYRVERDRALDAIEDAVRRSDQHGGDEPGEVVT